MIVLFVCNMSFIVCVALCAVSFYVIPPGKKTPVSAAWDVGWTPELAWAKCRRETLAPPGLEL
jgi:hypothetical protein